MSRLIDADALKDVIRQHDYPLADRLNSIDNGMFTLGIFQAIDEQPTISPDDVRGGGEWIRQEKSHPNCPEDSDYRYECSVCGWSDQHNAKMIVPFCWHCGARMKGAEDGTTE